tara:strand:+ start:1424 stop:1606 length:183 start_codon:yes stop_codon:yes gene_type:complete
MCAGLLGLAFLLFLLVDLGVWSFWGIQWYTVVFFLAALTAWGSGSCPQCLAMTGHTKKKK